MLTWQVHRTDFDISIQLASSHVLPGDLNAGLHDQRLALAFLQQNVARFGGDAEKVRMLI